jgi:hypothetical protein
MICRRHRAISLLLGYEPYLLDFLFVPARTRLKAGPRTMKREAAILGPQRHLLVKIALDIWSSTGGTRLSDTCRILAPHHYDCFLTAMEYLGATAALGCRCGHCQTLTAKSTGAYLATGDA